MYIKYFSWIIISIAVGAAVGIGSHKIVEGIELGAALGIGFAFMIKQKHLSAEKTKRAKQNS